MSEKKLKRLADFEWASAVRYIMYISGAIGLEDINSYYVASFPLARLGPEKLLKRKKGVLLRLKGNKSRIERFVGAFRAELTDNELAVLRGLYLQYRENEQTVRNHIGITETCIVEIELGILQSKEVGDDGLF